LVLALDSEDAIPKVFAAKCLDFSLPDGPVITIISRFIAKPQKSVGEPGFISSGQGHEDITMLVDLALVAQPLERFLDFDGASRNRRLRTNDQRRGHLIVNDGAPTQ
jgi:hypothetical protein